MQSLGLIKTFQTDFKQKSYRKRGPQEVKHTQVDGHSLLSVSNGLESTLASEESCGVRHTCSTSLESLPITRPHTWTRLPSSEAGCPILQDRGAQQLTPVYFLARFYSIAMLTVSPIFPRITISRLASFTSSSTIIPYLRFYSYSWKPEENSQDLVAQPQNDEWLVHYDSSSKIIQMPEINLSFGT